MKPSIALAVALMTVGFVFTSSGSANAVAYCQYVGLSRALRSKTGRRPGVRPVARAAAREAVRPGTPTNPGGPVDRVVRR